MDSINLEYTFMFHGVPLYLRLIATLIPFLLSVRAAWVSYDVSFNLSDKARSEAFKLDRAAFLP